MKAEKRHELEKNELADWIGEHIEAAKPYAPTIGIVLVGGTLAALLAIYLLGTSGTAAARAWSSYFTAVNEREPEIPLEQFVKELPGTPASLWAEQTLGDINLIQGSQALFSNREEAKKLLDKAEASLTKVNAEAKNPMLQARAKLSLAKLYEAKCLPEKAKQFYEEVVQLEKDSAIGKLAQQGVKRMSDPRDVELLAWFAEQKPRRPAAGMGTGGMPGLPNDLPARPDLSLPGLGTSPTDPGPGSGTGAGLNLDGLGTDKPAEPSLEFPKPGDTKPGETNPPETAPAEAPKTDGEKPAESKPPESKPDDTKSTETKPH
jgi:hypothetical protein